MRLSMAELTGTPEDDILFGTDESDTISGKAGNDTLFTGSGDDFLYGDEGNDLLIISGSGTATLHGGEGVDTFQMDLSSYQAPIENFVSEINLVKGLSGALGVENQPLADRLINIENIVLKGGYDAFLVGDEKDNRIVAGDGNDTVYGGAGNDELYTGSGDDFLYGDEGDDLLIISGSGTAMLDGGEGVDTFQMDLSSYQAPIENFVSEINLVKGLSGALGVENQPLADRLINIENIVLKGGYDAFLVGDEKDNRIVAGDGNDTVYGGAGNDELYTGSGDDFLYGDEGDDLLIISGSGTAMLDGGEGVDTFQMDLSSYQAPIENFVSEINLVKGLSGALGVENQPLADRLINIENIVLKGGYDAFLVGDEKDNRIVAGDGDDRLEGNGGSDDLNGGSGIDTAVFTGNRSSYTITTQDGVLTVKDNLGTDGTDTLANIEKLQFVDATWDVTDLVFDEETDVEGTVQENTEGADVFTGTAGIDKVVYNNARADIDVSVQDGVVRISNGDIIDELTDIERISFIDTSIALDIDGNAGSTAKILGAVFGKAALANKAYAGIGLSLLDSGEYTYESLMDYALTVAGAQSNAQVVELLYTNAIGVGPTTGQIEAFVALLENGSYTRASLGALAAEYAVNSVTLAGLAETGLEYIPFS